MPKTAIWKLRQDSGAALSQKQESGSAKIKNSRKNIFIQQAVSSGDSNRAVNW
jgi:hypothetical protein